MPHQYHGKIMPKFQDLDTEIRYMKRGAVRYALNGRSGSYVKGNRGVWENIRGTLYVPNKYLPTSGENKCIGTTTDIKNNRIIFYNWNSDGYNGIYLYQPQIESGDKIIPLFLDTPDNKILDFNKYFEIYGTKSCVVNGEHLFWTDGNYKPQRYLNIDWAISNKRRKWEIQISDKSIANKNILKVLKNGIQVSVYTGEGLNLIDSNKDLGLYFEVSNCDCGVSIIEIEPNTMSIEFIDLSYGRIVPQNFYPTPHNERQIDLVCYPFSHSPKVKLKTDRNIKRNFLNGNTLQFRVRIKYKDGNYSTWSAWSKSVNTSGHCTKKYNCIEIDYTDKIFDTFNDVNQLHLVESVLLGYRNGNKGSLFQFIEIPQCQIPKGEQIYKFYNDIHAIAQSDNDDLKPYDALPLKSGVLNFVEDRLVVGDGIENYDNNCFDFDIDVSYHPKEEDMSSNNGVATAYIEIETSTSPIAFNGLVMQMTQNANTYYYGFGGLNKGHLDNVDQRLGEKGFIGYIAGTNNYCISKQEILSGNVNIADTEHNVIYAVSGSDKDKINNTLVGNKRAIRSKLEFKGLADGTHIIRLASHWCSFGDKLGKGEPYDLNNGIEWQKTSTNVISVNGMQNVFEAVITIENGVMLGAPPTFKILDAHIGGDGAIEVTHSLVQGYVIDAISSSQKDLKKGTRVEHATVRFSRVVANSEIGAKDKVFTDHNGYFFKFAKTNLGGVGQSRILVAKDRDINWDIMPPSGAGDLTFLYNEDNPWKGNLGNLYLENCTTFNNSTDDFPVNHVINLICPPLGGGKDNIRNNFRTHIKGRLVDIDGNPVIGAVIVASGTSRFDTTDMNGNFKILLYTNYYLNRIDNRRVHLYSVGGRCSSLNMSMGYLIQMGIDKNNINNSYDVGDIVVKSIENTLLDRFYLKNGGVYDFGLTLMDRALRKTTVIFNEDKHRIRLPFTTEYIKDYFPKLEYDTLGNAITPTTKADGFFSVKIKPKDKPPIWAVSMYALRTQDEIYADYLQFVISDVKYVVNYDTKLDDDKNVIPDPVYTTYEANDANEVYLNLGSSFVEYQNRNSESVKAWTFQKGDRLRFIYDKNNNTRDFLELEIKYQRGDYFVIPYIESLREIFKGELVEVFRLKQKQEQKFFYETGEFIKVLQPYTGQREWEYNEVELNTGDAYRRTRVMYAKDSSNNTNMFTYGVEDMTPDDTYIEKDNDIGRADFINRDLKQIRKYAALRFGNNYMADSNRNSLRSFNLEDIIENGYKYGAISIIEDFGDILFVAQYSQCHTRGIKKTNAYLGDGQPMLLNSERFLSDPYFLSEDMGCMNPESFSRAGSSCKFFDSQRGVVGQYAKQAGLSNISGLDIRYGSRLNDKYFKEMHQNCNKIDKDIYPLVSRVYGVYNEREREYNLSFRGVSLQAGQDLSYLNGTGFGSNIGDNDLQFKKYDKSKIDVSIIPTTMTYDNTDNVWVGERSYVPEMYGVLMSDFFGFENGKLYIMEVTDVYNNFFGIQYKSKLSLVYNENPSDMKGFLAWSVESNKKWSNTNVEVFNNRAYRIQNSETPDELIRMQNGVFYAPFLMDKNTENVANPLFEGNRLSGETLILDIENMDTENVLLFSVNIYGQYLPRTNF